LKNTININKYRSNNTFQIALVTDGYYSFVIFNYGRIAWPNLFVKKLIQSGWNSGDNVNYYRFNTSSNDNLVKNSNVNIPSKWIFRVDYREEIINSFVPFGISLNDSLISKLSSAQHSEIIDTYDNKIRISHNHFLTSVCINKNGFVTLNVPYLYNQRENKFPLKDTISLISPFWTSINFTSNGNIFYRIVTDKESLEQIENDVNFVNINFKPIWSLVVTYYETVPVQLDKHFNNTFQLILTFDSNDYFYAIFNYGKMNSLESINSTSFLIGYSLELRDLYYNLNKMNNFVKNSNVNQTGKYVFNLFKPSDYTTTRLMVKYTTLDLKSIFKFYSFF
jgi:hypothetical protein